MAWEKILEILNVTRDMIHQRSTVTSTYQKLYPHCSNFIVLLQEYAIYGNMAYEQIMIIRTMWPVN